MQEDKPLYSRLTKETLTNNDADYYDYTHCNYITLVLLKHYESHFGHDARRRCKNQNIYA